MMHRVIVFGISLAVLCLPATVFGGWIEDFESYSVGLLTPQSDWENWNTAVEDPSVVVHTLIEDSNKKALAVAGNPDPATDLVHPFTGYDSGQYTFTAWQFVPSDSTTGTHYFIMLNSYPTDLNWSIQIPINLETGLLNDDYQAGDENVAIQRDKWVELRFEIDLDANTVDSYYDGTQFSTHQWADVANGGKLSIQALDLYPAANDVSVVYYDNFVLTPEPGTGILVLIGAVAGFLFWRRR